MSHIDKQKRQSDRRENDHSYIRNPWNVLRSYTDARIGMGRVGISQATSDHLEFQLAHASARDAVHQSVNWRIIHDALVGQGLVMHGLETQVHDRAQYLQRPDLGRRLDTQSADELSRWRNQFSNDVDVCLVIADGLSAIAVQQHAIPMVRQLVTDLKTIKRSCSTICLVSQGRVAIGDEISQRLKAKCVVVLIGERPGLSAFDSLGIYYTYMAHTGCVDAQRNCISNIRPAGLSFASASQRLLWLITESERLGLSGVDLKDDSGNQSSLQHSSRSSASSSGNFLIIKPD